MAKTIKISCQPDGNVSIEAMGFVGKSCLTATMGARRALLSDSSSERKLKPEFNRVEPQKRVAERQS